MAKRVESTAATQQTAKLTRQVNGVTDVINTLHLQTVSFLLRRFVIMSLLLLIILLVLFFGGLPNWGYHSYGYAPSGLAGVLLIIIIIMLLTGRL